MSIATVSIVSLPNQFEPVYTDGLWHVFFSPSYSITNYNYLVDVYSWNLNPSDPNGTQSLGVFKIPPRPNTGQGIFTPHKILKSQITNNYTTELGLTGISLSYGNIVQYWMDYGFQTSVDVPFIGTSQSGGNLVLEFATGDNIFIVDDRISIIMDNQKVNPQYNTTALVTNSTGDFVTTDIPFGATISNESGFIYILERYEGSTYASYSSATAGNYTWNAVRQYAQKGYDFDSPYVVYGSLRSKVLSSYTTDPIFPSSTQYPDNLLMTREGDYEVVSFLVNGDRGTVQADRLRYNGYRRSGSSWTTVQTLAYTFSSPIDFKCRLDVGVGPENLRGLFPGITFSGIDFYAVTLNQITGNTLIAPVVRGIDRTCTVYPVVRLRWLNRLGGYECYNFIRNSKASLNVKKIEWRQELPWDYTIGARQQSVLAQDTEISYEINTDWLSEYDYNYLQELITSPEVFRVEGTQSFPIVVTSANWKQKRQIDGEVFNLTLTYKDSYGVVTQDN
jgi:hypothetical protein